MQLLKRIISKGLTLKGDTRNVQSCTNMSTIQNQHIEFVSGIKPNANTPGKRDGLNMYQKAEHVPTYDRRIQLIIITGSVVLLASIVSILVVRSDLSIKFYHPTTSLSRNLCVMQGNS